MELSVEISIPDQDIYELAQMATDRFFAKPDSWQASSSSTGYYLVEEQVGKIVSTLRFTEQIRVCIKKTLDAGIISEIVDAMIRKEVKGRIVKMKKTGELFEGLG